MNALWNLVPSSSQGATPQQTLGTAVRNGLKNLLTGSMDKIWSGYWQCNTGSMDAFDNTRSAMTLANSSCLAAGNWYQNWSRCIPGEVMPQGDIVVSEHCYVILDWKLVNGVTMFLIDAHLGYTLLMPREVFNMEMGRTGCGTFMGANKTVEATRVRSLQQWLLDAIQNIIIYFQYEISLFKTN